MGKRSREKQENKENAGEVLPEKSSGVWVSILRKIIFIGTGLILFTPFIISGKYFFPFVGPKSLYFMALVEIIFAAWLILIYLAPRFRPRLNVLTIALVLFLLSAILSTFLGADPARSFWSKYERMTGLLMYFHLFFFFLVICSTFRKKEDWLKIFGISVFASTVMGLVALFTLMGINLLGNLAQATRGGATIGNSSFLGTYLLLNFFLALYLVFNTKNFWRILSIAGIFVVGGALIFSTARAALLSTAGGLILLGLLWMFFNKRKGIKIAGLISVIVLILGVGVLGYLATKPGNYVSDFAFSQIGNTFGGRLIVWEGAWKGFVEKPVFGWGPENFDYVFTRHFNPCMLGPDCGGDIWYDRAHNIVFDTLVMTGIVGLLTYLGLFLVTFFVLWKNYLAQNIGFWTAGIFTVAFIAYFIQNLTVFDMVNSYMMFFLMLGFIGTIAAARNEESATREKEINYLVVGIVLVLSIVAFSSFVLGPLKADRDVITTMSYPQFTQQRLDFYKKTLEVSPVGRYQIVDFLSQTDLEALQSSQSSEVSAENIKMVLDFDAQELENIIKESPLDFRTYLRLGQVYNAYIVIGDTSKLARAEEILEEGIKVSPTNQQGYWTLAQTKIYQGDFQGSLSLAETALKLEPKSRNGNFIVIQIAKIMGDNDLMRQKIQEAIKNNSALEEEILQIFGMPEATTSTSTP